MKKQILFIIALVSLFSCTEDIRFNNPSFQGVKDNVFWRAIESRASVSANGSLIIEAYTGTEVIVLKTNSTAVKTYFLGTSTTRTASYEMTDSTGKLSYSTGFGIGDGQIVITEFDAISNTVSGTFRFNAENANNNPLAGPVLNFQHGVFYRVPIR